MSGARSVENAIKSGILALAVLVPLAVVPNADDATLAKEIVVDAVVFGCALLWAMGSGKVAMTFKRTPVDLMIGVYFVLGASSVLTSDYAYAGIDRLLRLGAYFTLFFLCVNFLRDRKDVERIMWGVVVSGAIVSVYGIVQYSGHGFLFPMEGESFRLNYEPRSFSTLGHPNLFGGFTVIAIFMCLGLFLGCERGQNVWRRLFLGGAMGIMVIALLMSKSRGAWIGFACGLGSVMLMNVGWIIRRIWALAAGGVVLAALLYFALPDWVGERLISGAAVRSRLVMWDGALEMVGDSPLFGKGIGLFRVYFPEYRGNDYWLKGVDQNVGHAHNEFLEVMSEMGILGLGAFLGILALFFVQVKRFMETSQDRKATLLVVSLSAGMIGTLTHSLVSVGMRFTSTGTFFYLSMGLAMALMAVKFDWNSIKLPQVGRLAVGLCAAAVLSVSMYKDVRASLSEIFLLNGKFEMADGRLLESQKELKRAAELNEHNLKALYKLGAVHIGLRDFDSALDVYERLGKLAPNYAEIHNNLGLSHKELGEIDRAIEEYKKAVDLRDDAENRFALALLFEMKGDRDGMIREYERFLPVARASLDLHRGYRDEFMAYERSEDVTGEVVFIGRLSSTISTTYKNLMGYYQENGLWERAEWVLRGSMPKADDDGRVHYYLGWVLSNLGRQEEAKEEYRRAIQIDPRDARSMNNLGFLYADAGENLDEALWLIGEAIRLDSSNRLYYLDTLGWAYCQKGDYDKAVEILSEEIGEASRDGRYGSLTGEMAYHLGVAYQKSGKLQEAKKEFERALEYGGTAAAKAKGLLEEVKENK